MKNSYLILHFAIVLASFTGIFGKIITLNEGLLVWYRVILTSIILFFLLKFSKISTKIQLREKFYIAKIGLLLTIHWVFFYASIKYSNISVGVVCFCLTSFFTAIFEPIINKKRVSFIQLLLSSIALLGICFIFHFDASYQIGIALGIISAAFAALYTIFNERLVRTYDSKLINFYQMFSGVIGLGILMPVYLYLFPVQTIIPSLRDAIYLILLVVFCTVILYILFAEVLKTIPAFTVNLSFNIEPIYAIIIAFIFFNEGKEVSMSFYYGLFFVVLSVLLQTLISMRKKV